jgi:hypothetical protein
MPLTEVVVRNAKPKDKPQKLTDGDGMFLYVHPNGGKYWRLQYRFAGKQKVLALGVYPETSLADARDRRAQARKVLAAGNDPGEVKKEAKRLMVLNSENTFEAIAREWHEQRRHEWKPHYAADMLNRIETHIIPRLGKRPIADLTSAEILSAMRIIEATGALDLAQRMMQTCGMVIRYAIATGRANRNPVADLRGALKTPIRNNHTYLKAEDLPEYLKKLENFDGTLQTALSENRVLLRG